MLGDLFRWFTGYRKYFVDAEFRTRASEALFQEGIRFRSVKPKNNKFRFIVFGKDVRACEMILGRTGIPYASGAYRGFLPAAGFALRRPGLILGAVLFLLLNILSSHVIWDITVRGNEAMTDGTVIGILEECGFTYGTFIPSIDFDSLHSRIMADHPEIAWISVNVTGSVADVQVRETRFDEREDREEGVFSNIIAAEDGRLIEFRVDGGYAVRSPGDVVKKGQLLVSGVVPLREGGTRFSYPSGEVLAEVERSVTVRADLLSEQKVYTGRENTEYSIKIFKKKLNLFSNGGKEYGSYDKIESETRVFLFGSVPLPVWIEKTKDTEYVRVRNEHGYREALDEALSELRYETGLMIGDGELLRKKIEVTTDEDGISLTCRVLVLTDVAVKQEFRAD